MPLPPLDTATLSSLAQAFSIATPQDARGMYAELNRRFHNPPWLHDVIASGVRGRDEWTAIALSGGPSGASRAFQAGSQVAAVAAQSGEVEFGMVTPSLFHALLKRMVISTGVAARFSLRIDAVNGFDVAAGFGNINQIRSVPAAGGVTPALAVRTGTRAVPRGFAFGTYSLAANTPYALEIPGGFFAEVLDMSLKDAPAGSVNIVRIVCETLNQAFDFHAYWAEVPSDGSYT